MLSRIVVVIVVLAVLLVEVGGRRGRGIARGVRPGWRGLHLLRFRMVLVFAVLLLRVAMQIHLDEDGASDHRELDQHREQHRSHKQRHAFAAVAEEVRRLDWRFSLVYNNIKKVCNRI